MPTVDKLKGFITQAIIYDYTLFKKHEEQRLRWRRVHHSMTTILSRI